MELQDFGPKVWLGEQCSSAEPGSSPVCWLSPRPGGRQLLPFGARQECTTPRSIRT